MADLVIVGRVTAPGTTRQLAQPPQTPIGPTRAVPGTPAAGDGGISVPVTTYSVNVERVARGSAAPGSQLSVAQSGNPIRGAVPTQDDAPLAADERYVLFLQKADAATFLVVGDIQGRLSIDAQARVHPVGSGSPATRGHDGQPLDAFLKDVAAIS